MAKLWITKCESVCVPHLAASNGEEARGPIMYMVGSLDRFE